MRSKKRRRTPSEHTDALSPQDTAPGKVPSSFERFGFLPSELRQLVLELACLRPSSSGRPSRHHYDVTTLLSLSLVCRDIHHRVTGTLWADVTITRPSALYAFHRALETNSDRAQLVRSLHIGPLDLLPPNWWPLSKLKPDDMPSVHTMNDSDVPQSWILTSLDTSRLPAGCEDRQPWPLDCMPSGCRNAAIYDAVQAAQDRLGIRILKEEQRRERLDIIKIYEVQAALDLYLELIKRMEDQDPQLLRLAQPGARVPARCRNGKCDHYPSLLMSPNPHLRTPANTFHLTLPALIRYLARPGSTTDRFDHPLLFMRSGLKAIVYQHPEAVRRSKTYRGAGYQIVPRPWVISEEHDEKYWPYLASLRAEEDESTAAAVATATVFSNLRLARQVLTLTAKLSSLSLTGFLERAVHDGSNQNFLPASLRRLSLGPAPCGWALDLPLSGLDSIEELRICGERLGETELAALSKLTRLQRLDWTVMEEFEARCGLSIAETIKRLVQGSGTSGQASSLETAQERHPSSEDEASVPSNHTRPTTLARASSATTTPTPLVVARLHPTNVTELLGTAPSVEARGAWLSASPVAAQSRRLLLLKYRGYAPKSGDTSFTRPSADSRSRLWLDMYDEGNCWRQQQ